MQQEVIIAGFGGQGVLFAGQLLAYAGLSEDKYVTWIPSYGPEMRGGTAHCTVIISDEEIGSPLVSHPLSAIVLNPPSMERYAELVKPGGVLVLDSDLVSRRSFRNDIREFAIPAKQMAEELGFNQIGNMVLLGALVEATGIVKLETLENELKRHLSERHQDAIEADIEAMRRGAAQVKPATMPVFNF